MQRLIQEVVDGSFGAAAYDANAVAMDGQLHEYCHGGELGYTSTRSENNESYQRTPRSTGQVDLAARPQSEQRNMVQYKSLFARPDTVHESSKELSDEESSSDEDLSSTDGEDDYEDSTMTSQDEEAYSGSWGSVTTSASCLHYIPRKSMSDSDISPVNIPFGGSLKPDTQGTDSLVNSLNKALEAKVPHQRGRGSRRLSVSKFTRAFNVLKTSIHRTSYTLLSHSGHIMPFVTDDALPEVSSCHEDVDIDSDNEISDEECEVHECASGAYPHPALKLPRGPQYRGRDPRMNSTFLRLYAMDYDARCSSLLPCAYTSRELSYVINQSRATKAFHRRYNIIRISDLSRDKLWDSVVLPPRVDEPPSMFIDLSNYIYVGDERKGPKVHFQDDRLMHYPNAAGVLNTGKSYRNGDSPQAGKSRPQYTKKGWCNPRWVDSSSNF